VVVLSFFWEQSGIFQNVLSLKEKLMHDQKSFAVAIYFEYTQNIPWEANKNELSRSITLLEP